MADTGYATTAPINGGGGGKGVSDTVAAAGKPGDYWTLEQCKQAYLDYTGSKSQELEEIKEARRYRHHSQWTAAQIKVLNDRKQPVVTYPRIGRKIDGIVGTVERLKQDPKAYPRTPQQEQGASLSTAALRYALESQQWVAKTPIVADNCATDGHSGIELELVEGDKGDKEVGFNLVEDGYFYDPRSFRLDFSDARYDGVSKLVDIDTAIEMMPDNEEELRSATDTGSELSTNSDRDNKWFTTIGKRKFIRLVDLWYRHKGEYCWSIFTGSTILMEGQSYFYEKAVPQGGKAKTISKYLMFRCAVDQDGDSYGFVRALKSSQDEINQRRSKGLHILNTRRINAEVGAFDDVELARREAARPDGFVLRNRGFEAEFEDQSKQLELSGQLKFLEDAKAEIDNYGPSQVVTGEGVDNQSGRAIALRQNAAMAELGPFLLSYRGWKLRVYRAVFAAIQKHWTGERWIRVTDDEGLAQFIQINGQQQDPMTGQQQIVNALGSVDVDIILDEGPDTINAQADFYETLKEIIPAVANVMPPQKVSALVDSFISNSTLPSEAKKKYSDVGKQMEQQPPPPDPEVQKAQAQLQIEQQKAQQDAALKQQQQQADVQLEEYKTQREIELERAKASAQIEIAQQKAAADIQIAREKAHMDAQIQQHKAEQDAKVLGFKAKNDQQHQQMKFKFESEMKRRQADGDATDEGETAVESSVMRALEHIAEIAGATHKAAVAPRKSTLIRGRDGRAAGSISTIEAQQ